MSVVYLVASNLAISSAQDPFDDRKAQSPGSGVVASSMSGRLKSELLANLNKYSNMGSRDELEVVLCFDLTLSKVLGSSDNSNVEKPRQVASFVPEESGDWQPIPSTTPSFLQNLLGGLSSFTLPTLPPLFPPITLAPPATQRPIRNFFAGQRDRQPDFFGREDNLARAENVYTVAITPIPFTLPSLQPPLLGRSHLAPVLC